MQCHHTAIQPNNHTTVLPYYLLPFYNIYYHTTTLPYCHTTILHFCHTILPHYPAALLQYCYTEILPHCHTAILPYCQTSILPLPLLLRLSPTPIHTYISNTPILIILLDITMTCQLLNPSTRRKEVYLQSMLPCLWCQT